MLTTDSTMAHRMEAARTDTLRLFALVRDEADLRRPPAPGFRPILWHLGHIAAYEAYWIIGRSKGTAVPSALYESLFDPIRTPREDANNLPPRGEIDAYLARVRGESLDYLGTPAGAEDRS